MTVRNKPLVAVDTCAIIELFLASSQAKAEAVQGIFDSPEHQVVLPTFVGVELVACVAMRQGVQQAPINNAEMQQARAFLESCGALFAELDQRTMRRAGELGPQLLLKPADATVLATALSAGCEKLFTYDQQLIKNAKLLPGIEVIEPYPSVTLFPSSGS